MFNFAEGLVTTDKDSQIVPCLAKDWRWVDDTTIEFKLREDVRFHNGERFDSGAVRSNWQAYKQMKSPRPIPVTNLPDQTILRILDDFTIRFVLPEPDGLALVKFEMFLMAAPTFFEKYKVAENGWLYLPEAGPWGTGPFKFVEGNIRYQRPSREVILEANEDYWDARYPKVRKVVFNNDLLADRAEAMRLCGESEGNVDIVK
jgi:peptide/nickel transport system substrate-binding protein